MSTPIAKGARVRQIVPVIAGEVVQKRYREDTDSLEYLVQYTAADGAVHERWFAAEQLELVEEQQ